MNLARAPSKIKTAEATRNLIPVQVPTINFSQICKYSNCFVIYGVEIQIQTPTGTYRTGTNTYGTGTYLAMPEHEPD